MAKKHKGHDQHLCALFAGGEGLEDVKARVGKARYICARCGRAAQKKKHLCKPQGL